MATSTLKIAAIPGDGTGPEVTAEALKVLDAVSSIDAFAYDVEMLDWGGDRYLKTGEIIPEGGLDCCEANTPPSWARSAIQTLLRVFWRRGCSSNCGSNSTSTSTSGR